MSPKETAYIVERLAVRFMAMVADYERKLVEHRDSFGARTSADAKIIEGLRRELFMLTGLNDKLIVDREEAWKERDGLLTQVQDQRAEIERLTTQMADQELSVVGIVNERNDAWERCDALRAEVAAAPRFKVGDKLESYNRSLGLAIPVTVVGVRTVYDCQGDGAEYPVGHSESELKDRYVEVASHDTPSGKEAAEAVVRDSQMTDTHDCGPNCPHCSW